MKIIGIAGSTSKNSINKSLVSYVGSQLKDFDFELLDLNDYEMPIYSIDYQNAHGIPDKAQAFFDKINEAQGIVISLAEHNGNFATALKNIIDWVSRIKMTYLEDKPLVVMATSPGANGARSVLEVGVTTFSFAGAKIIGRFSLPLFYENFVDDRITDQQLDDELHKNIALLKDALHAELTA